MSVSAAIRREVETRAGNRCEYCGMHQSLQGGLFHVEHVVPTAAGGLSSIDNLALACPGCNLRKSNRLRAHDRESGTDVPLFNPRTNRRSDHFQWLSYQLVGITPQGRATIAALDLNHARRIKIRQAEELFGLFPPND